ncbi:hypothetical protein GN316_01795 [Xylophilus sp. Kf1]|nr:hypothetical protein [Xylophilus sp. Kf1]
MHCHAETAGRAQRGVALLVVVLLLLLCGLAVLSLARVTLLNETLVGGAADYSRAFAAAQALIDDAETDIRGRRSDGGATRAVASGVYYPEQPVDLRGLAQAVGAHPDLPCRDGICLPAHIDQLTSLYKRDDLFSRAAQPVAVHAGYGQFTGAATSSATRPYLDPERAGYWVEVFEHPPGAGLAAEDFRYAPDATRPFVFRITAVAQGRRTGVRAVLREVFVPSALIDNP